MTDKFIGAAAVCELVVFAPRNANVIGIYNTPAGTFEASVTTGSLTISNKFIGAAAVGNLVVFAPHNAGVVGIYNTQTGTFDASVTTGFLTINNKFVGAAAVGELVVFAPLNAEVVGIYNTQTGTFDASVTTGSLTMDSKFSGAAAVGELVVFAPRNADAVGIFFENCNVIDSEYGWERCQLPSFDRAVCTQKRKVPDCKDVNGNLVESTIQYRSCSRAEECRVEGMSVIAYLNVPSGDFDTILLNEDESIDVSSILRESFLWNVAEGERLFSGLSNATSSYVLLYQGQVYFAKQGLYKFSIESSGAGRLNVMGVTVAEVSGSLLRRRLGIGTVFVDAANVTKPMEILSYRGGGAHYFRVEVAFEDGDFDLLNDTGILDLDFDFPNVDDVCQANGVPCSGNGLCFETACTCDFGYAGDLCGVASCDTGVVCSNGGTCYDGTCVCSSAWAGPTCDDCSNGIAFLGCEIVSVGAIAAIVAFCCVILLLCLGARQLTQRLDSKLPFFRIPSLAMGSRSLIPFQNLKDLELIAAGSHGQVFRGQYGYGQVAIKKYFVADDGDNTTELVAEWKRESGILKSLRHPNIIQVFPIFETVSLKSNDANSDIDANCLFQSCCAFSSSAFVWRPLTFTS
jgi:hypothetical protein